MRLLDIGLPYSKNKLKLTVTVRPGSEVIYNEGKGKSTSCNIN